MNRRALTTIVLLCSAVVFAAVLPPIAFAQNNPFVGTWKFNLEKSKYLGAAPKSITSIIEAVGQGLRATVELIDAQGNAVKVDYVVRGGEGGSTLRGKGTVADPPALKEHGHRSSPFRPSDSRVNEGDADAASAVRPLFSAPKLAY
jgi:hypothetical protein